MPQEVYMTNFFRHQEKENYLLLQPIDNKNHGLRRASSLTSLTFCSDDKPETELLLRSKSAYYSSRGKHAEIKPLVEGLCRKKVTGDIKDRLSFPKDKSRVVRLATCSKKETSNQRYKKKIDQVNPHTEIKEKIKKSDQNNKKRVRSKHRTSPKASTSSTSGEALMSDEAVTCHGYIEMAVIDNNCLWSMNEPDDKKSQSLPDLRQLVLKKPSKNKNVTFRVLNGKLFLSKTTNNENIS